MKAKSEVYQRIKDFCAMVHTQFNIKIQTIRSDNGSEFVSNPMKTFFENHGIMDEPSCIETPQQNGRVERKHRHILNIARALRFGAHLPIEFWGERVLTAIHLINRTPTKVLQGKTPYEMLFQSSPSYDHLRVFGCLCYAHASQRRKDKFGERSKRCIFVGYPHGKKGWKVYDIESGEIFVSRDVIFHEDVYPFATNGTANIDSERVGHEYGLPDPSLWAAQTNDDAP